MILLNNQQSCEELRVTFQTLIMRKSLDDGNLLIKTWDKCWCQHLCIKSQGNSVSHRAFFTLSWSVSWLNDIGESVRVTKTFRSCRPAWLEMDRKVCPTTNTCLSSIITRGGAHWWETPSCLFSLYFILIVTPCYLIWPASTQVRSSLPKIVHFIININMLMVAVGDVILMLWHLWRSTQTRWNIYFFAC